MTRTDGETRRILIIDDNPHIHEDFRRILMHDRRTYQAVDHLASDYFENRPPEPACSVRHAYALDFAVQGSEGVMKVENALAVRKPYMVVFVDMRIPPGMNGIETIREIIKRDPFIQIVLCTAYSDYSFTEIQRSIGATSNFLILKKPFDTCEVEQLASTLSEKWFLARKSRLRKEELNRLIERRTETLTQVNKALEQEISERRRAEDSIKILTQENIRIQEKERQRIACDLHDSVAQDLAALLIKQELILESLAEGSFKDAAGEVETSIRILKSTIQNVRNISYNLRPPSLNEFGMVHAMSRLCENFFKDDGIHVSFISSGMKNKRFDYTTEINLYRIFQEALNNIRNHAVPKNVMVSLVATAEHTTLSIRDDGVGFDTADRLHNAIQERRMGLKGIEERVNLINGQFDLNSSPHQGTEIVVRIFEHRRVNEGQDHLFCME